MPQTGQLKFGRTEAGYCLRAEGRCTSAHSPAVETFVGQALSQPDCCIVVDLSSTDYIDSTFLGCLLGLHRKHHAAKFRVAAPAGLVAKLFGASRLDRVLHVTQEVPAILGDYCPLPPQCTDARQMAAHIMECHRRLAEIPGPQQQVFASIAQQMEKELQRQK